MADQVGDCLSGALRSVNRDQGSRRGGEPFLRGPDEGPGNRSGSFLRTGNLSGCVSAAKPQRVVVHRSSILPLFVVGSRVFGSHNVACTSALARRSPLRVLVALTRVACRWRTTTETNVDALWPVLEAVRRALLCFHSGHDVHYSRTRVASADRALTRYGGLDRRGLQRPSLTMCCRMCSIARDGLSPFGQTSVQFMIVRHRYRR